MLEFHSYISFSCYLSGSRVSRRLFIGNVEFVVFGPCRMHRESFPRLVGHRAYPLRYGRLALSDANHHQHDEDDKQYQQQQPCNTRAARQAVR